MHKNDKRMNNCRPVTNEFLGILKNSNGVFSLINNESYNSKNPNIAIILESPHRSEYDEDGNPIKSANGKTGENLEKNLGRKINEAIANKNLKLNNQEYNVFAVNAIQYQCSLGLRPIIPILRNSVFRLLWLFLETDFINRINKINPVLIINMCTGGAKAMYDYINNQFKNKDLPLNLIVHISLINKIIVNKNIDYYYCIHPSSGKFKKEPLRKV